jgi:hypothetical protein
MRIGHALIVGRTACMTAAKVNTPYGPGFQKHMRRWLHENGLSDIDTHERTNAIHMVEHEADIETWRNGLGEVARRRANHPNTVIAHWRNGSSPQRQGPKQKPHVAEQDLRRDAQRAGYAGGPRPQRPEGDLIRRVATAMRSSGKQDWLQLATIAIEALTVEDLRDLMPKAKAAQFEMELRA